MEKLTILLFVTAMVTVNADKRYNDDNAPGTSEVHFRIQENGKKPITHTARGDNLDISTSYRSVNRGESSNRGNNRDFQPENNQGYNGNYGSNKPTTTPQRTPGYGNSKPAGKPPRIGSRPTDLVYTSMDTSVSVNGHNNRVLVNNHNAGRY